MAQNPRRKIRHIVPHRFPPVSPQETFIQPPKKQISFSNYILKTSFYHPKTHLQGTFNHPKLCPRSFPIFYLKVRTGESIQGLRRSAPPLESPQQEADELRLTFGGSACCHAFCVLDLSSGGHTPKGRAIFWPSIGALMIC